MTSSYNKIPPAKKSLGQNFLQDDNIARKIVAALDIQPCDHVIEIGPGPGALTRHLLQSPARRLSLIEKDSYWAKAHACSASNPVSSPTDSPVNSLTASPTPRPATSTTARPVSNPTTRPLVGPVVSPGAGLESQEPLSCALLNNPEVFYAQQPRLAVYEADALLFPWHLLTRPVKIIGNLPYNVASPLMWEIVSRSRGLARAVFMVQKEVGLRLTATPRTADYGALSVWVQSFCETKVEFIVPPQVFFPRPKIFSAVVSFSPVEVNGQVDYDRLAWLLKVCFQARRKQLGNSLKKIAGIEEAFQKTGILATQRPEELRPEAFHNLVMALFPKKH